MAVAYQCRAVPAVQEAVAAVAGLPGLEAVLVNCCCPQARMWRLQLSDAFPRSAWPWSVHPGPCPAPASGR